MVGKADEDFGVPKELADSFRQNVLSIMKKGKMEIVYEDSKDAKTGEIRHFKSIKKPFKSLDGKNRILVISHDITDYLKAKEKIEAEHAKLNTILQTTQDAFWLSDKNGFIIDLNPAMEALYGYAKEEAIGMHVSQLDFHDDMHRSKARIQYIIEHGQMRFETQHISKNNTIVDAEVSVTYIHKQELFVVFSRDITERKAHEKQLEHIAHYDALTGLPNRLLFSARLYQAISQVNRQASVLAVAYLDLDGFKEVNDQYGHEAGDKLLISISHRLKDVLRQEDMIARLGGDEFVCVMVDLKKPADCVPVLKRMLTIVKEPIAIDGEMLEVSASIGVTFYTNKESIDADQLIRQSDMAMYEAKQSGKNRFHIFDTEYDKSLRSHYENIERIKEALQNEEFVLYYQPKVNMKTGEIIGAEALIRWMHPTKGIISPAEFLPIIDNHFLIVELGYWVIEKAMTYLSSQCDASLCLPVSVNIHAMQLQQHNFVATIEKLLGKYPKIKEGMIEFEILETSALEDISSIKEIILECRALGIGFSLDDFGTGYSSLTYLKKLPVDTLKIDSSFVIDMLEDEDDHAIVKGIVDLSKTFNRKVIAEGVETLAHCQALLALGCENAQGYFIAKPMHPQKLQEWIENWSVENLQN